MISVRRYELIKISSKYERPVLNYTLLSIVIRKHRKQRHINDTNQEPAGNVKQ